MDSCKVEIEFTCPACSSIATQPVVAQDGFIYHKDCANDFLQTEFGKTSFISQVTGKVVGGTLIPLVEPAIQLFQQCKTKETKDEDEGVVDTIMKAKLGDTQCMALLGRWHLFGEQENVQINLKHGFDLVKKSHDDRNIEATAYYGHCLIRGMGTEKNKEDGFEALVEAASEGNGAGKDFAAWTLGLCYREGLHGFKQDERKASKWMNKVINMPDVSLQKKIWEGYDLEYEEGTKLIALTEQNPLVPMRKEGDEGQKLLFDDIITVTTATTISSKDQSTNSDVQTLDAGGVQYLLGGLETLLQKRCEVCFKSVEPKDILGSSCLTCAMNNLYNEFNYLPSGLDDQN